MTVARARGVGIAGALVVCWAVAAVALSRTSVPDDLVLPRVDVDAVFGADLVARAERYRRFLYVNWLLAEAALLLTLGVYARRGARLVRESAAGPIGTGMLLGMLGLGLAWLVRLPFSVAALWWQRRHGLSSQGYAHLLVDGWLGLAGTFVALSLALLVVMALARRLGSWWWLPGSLVLAAVATSLVLVEPYLTSGLEPVGRPRIERAYERFRVDQGVGAVPLRAERVSGSTSLANAYAFGLGPSRRVVLWDTLLDGRFTERQIDVVLAHELGHHAEGHIAKAIGWFTLFALPGAFVLMLATRHRRGMGEPAAVPLALLVVAVLQLVATPAQNLVGRRMEAEADWRALQTTHDPAAARGLFRELAATSLGDPGPPAWAQLLFGTHPTLADRVAMADAWAARRAAAR
jgi:STE24 endopeptidase